VGNDVVALPADRLVAGLAVVVLQRGEQGGVLVQVIFEGHLVFLELVSMLSNFFPNHH